MKKILLPVVAFAFLASLGACHDHDALTAEEKARRDSAALHVALMPVADCMPFYVAAQAGIYQQLGLDLRILTYQAQLDTDSALERGHAEVVFSDLARAIMMQQDSTALRVIATFDGTLQLITPRRGRIRKLSQLKERMVAVARHSVTDYWSDRLTDTAGLARPDIFRPQINSLRIRTDMLCNGTMDAAFLPEPYASEALLRGHTCNFSTHKLSPHMVALVAEGQALQDSTRRRQIALLLEGYDRAVALCDSLALVGPTAARPSPLRDSIASLLRTHCLTPDTLTDSILLRLPRFTPLTTPEKADVETVMQWLRSRDKVKKGYTADSLLYAL